MEKKMPKATAKRLPVYLRYLKMLGDSGVKRIKSREFSEMIQIPSERFGVIFPTLVNWAEAVMVTMCRI